MANFVTFTVLFFILPLSNARMRPLNTPGNAINGDYLPGTEVNSLLSVSTSVKLLPVNLPEKETDINELAENLSENDPHANEIAVLDLFPPERVMGINELAEKLPDTGSESESETETDMVKSSPLMMATSRPYLRHHHHHGHHQLFPYSKNMLIPTGEKGGDFDPVIIHHHRFHRIPSRWSRFSLPFLHHHHHHNHNNDDNDDEESKSVFKRSATFSKYKFKTHFHHHDDEDVAEKPKQFEVKIHKHEHKYNGLLQRIRKMLIF